MNEIISWQTDEELLDLYKTVQEEGLNRIKNYNKKSNQEFRQALARLPGSKRYADLVKTVNVERPSIHGIYNLDDAYYFAHITLVWEDKPIKISVLADGYTRVEFVIRYFDEKETESQDDLSYEDFLNMATTDFDSSNSNDNISNDSASSESSNDSASSESSNDSASSEISNDSASDESSEGQWLSMLRDHKEGSMAYDNKEGKFEKYSGARYVCPLNPKHEIYKFIKWLWKHNGLGPCKVRRYEWPPKYTNLGPDSYKRLFGSCYSRPNQEEIDNHYKRMWELLIKRGILTENDLSE